MAKQFTVIIPAAGVGSRFGADIPKQYTLIHGVSVLQHTVNTFLANSRIGHIAVIVSPDDKQVQQFVTISKQCQIYPIGGQTRAETVKNALNYLLTNHHIEQEDTVLVHDAARCCLKQPILNRLLDVLPNREGAILAIPVADTLKRQTSGQNRIETTVARQGLWQAQTPQAFQAALLQRAFSDVDLNKITDEASAVEYLGMSPLLIEGDSRNIKLTRPEDKELVSCLLS